MFIVFLSSLHSESNKALVGICFMELLFLLMFIIAGRCQQMKDVMQMLLKHFTIRPPDEPRNANVADTFTIRPPDETCNENVTDTFHY